LTQTGKQELEKKAKEIGVSVSELIERIARGTLIGQENPSKKNLIDLWIQLRVGIQKLQNDPSKIN
jgi:hypothetical protein